MSYATAGVNARHKDVDYAKVQMMSIVTPARKGESKEDSMLKQYCVGLMYNCCRMEFVVSTKQGGTMTKLEETEGFDFTQTSADGESLGQTDDENPYGKIPVAVGFPFHEVVQRLR